MKNYNCKFEDIDIVGYGPVTKSNGSVVSLLRAAGCRIYHVPMRSVKCDGCPHYLRRANSQYPDHPYDSKTDLADMELIKQMFLHVMDQGSPCNLVVISSDSDFISSINELVKDNCIVMSAVDEDANWERCLAETATWEWSKLKKGLPPINDRKKWKKQTYAV